MTAFAVEHRHVRRRAEHQREVRAGRVARDGDFVGVDAERLRIRAQPAQRRLDVVDLGRPYRLARQPILGRDADEAISRELNAVTAQLGAIAVLPAAAVDQQNRRAVVALIGRREHVATQVAAAAAAEYDVVLNLHSTG